MEQPASVHVEGEERMDATSNEKVHENTCQGTYRCRVI